MNKQLKIFLNVIIFPFPWIIRKFVYVYLFKYEIDKTAKIKRSIVLAEKLVMRHGSKIENFNFINEIDYFFLDEYAQIGRGNWFTGLSTKYTYNFTYSVDRQCIFKLGKHARITNSHLLDCTGGISIGKFSTIAGVGSVFLSHAIDIEISRQTAGPLEVGDYCFVSTNCKILKDTKVPDCSVLGAGAVLTKKFETPYSLIGGVPAKRIKDITEDAKYFKRDHGHVN